MSDNSPRMTAFRQRLRDKQHLLGTFIKTPTTHATEILGRVGFDFVILDQEHAPLDRGAIDVMVLAAHAVDMAALVRVGDGSASSILSVLDCGATGVLVPHVDSPTRAREVAAACRYRSGSRGYSNTTRAGGYGGAGLPRHIAEQDAQVACVVMIEDVAALEEIEAIAATPGIDAFFIGRGDLTAAMGLESPTDGQVFTVVERITKAAGAAGMPVMVLPSNKADAAAMYDLGATAFVLQNDQSFLKQAAAQALADYAAPLR